MTTTTPAKLTATTNGVTIETYEATSADWTMCWHVRAFRGDPGLARNNFAWAIHADREVARGAANSAFRLATEAATDVAIRQAVFAR